MDKYYYFASQLPFLKFNQRTYINKEFFLTEARKWLTNRDLAALYQVDINDFYYKESDIKILKEYKDFERKLREEIASFRKPQAPRADDRPLGFLKPDILKGSPLEVEKKLLFLRWQFIEEKEGGHYFDLEFFLMYFLKLQILERLFIFDKEKGIAEFDTLCEVKL